MNDVHSVIERFYNQALKLEDEKFDDLDSQSVQMSFVADGKNFGKVSSKLPDADLVKLFLIDFRFFYIKKNNQHSFEAVCKLLLDKNFMTKEVQDWLFVYDHVFKDDSVRVQINQKQLTTKMLFETILNAETFHQEGSQKGVELITASPFVEPLARMKFFALITKLRKIICSFNRQIVEPYRAEHASIN